MRSRRGVRDLMERRRDCGWLLVGVMCIGVMAWVDYGNWGWEGGWGDLPFFRRFRWGSERLVSWRDYVGAA